MKLPDFTNNLELLALRKKMGANKDGEFSTGYKPDELTFDEENKLKAGGIDVNVDEILKLPDGTLGYKSSRVLVHIRDVPVYGGNFDAPRFHMAWCRTLQEMTEIKRFHRYVVATREDGSFRIHRIKSGQNSHGSLEKLIVCQNCLSKLAFDGFDHTLGRNERQKIVKQFSIPRFFETYPKSLLNRKPEFDDEGAPFNDYTEDFQRISRSIKEKRKWKCENCGFDGNKKGLFQYIETHHINGKKFDNSEHNLEVVCLRCHAEKPQHAHIKRSPRYKQFMEKHWHR